MRKGTTFLLFTIMALSLLACRQRHSKNALQGDWYRDGFDIKAFSVQGDLMYFPGLEKGYPFDLSGDTLIVHFAKSATKSKILSASSTELTVWDMSLSRDTIKFKRVPSIMDVSEGDKSNNKEG